ncbi:hypothetical protein NHG29_09130 [Aerococcaceae bacterium NML160702]|nr:hypothetical protein [Aerococcaceae bacterium NML160702]
MKNPNDLTGKKVVITTIDNVKITGKCTNDSELEFIRVKPDNLQVKKSIKVGRSEIFQIEEKN